MGVLQCHDIRVGLAIKDYVTYPVVDDFFCEDVYSVLE